MISYIAVAGEDLRKKGLNRIGNLLVPNDNYCKFEDWVMPILDQLLVEQEEQVCLETNISVSTVAADPHIQHIVVMREHSNRVPVVYSGFPIQKSL